MSRAEVKPRSCRGCCRVVEWKPPPLSQGFLASLFWPDDDADPPPAAPHGTAGEAAGPADAVEVYRAKGELAVADEEEGQCEL